MYTDCMADQARAVITDLNSAEYDGLEFSSSVMGDMNSGRAITSYVICRTFKGV